MAAAPRLLPPDSIGRALTPLAELSEQEFKLFASATSTTRGFSLSPEQIRELSAALPSVGTQLTYALGALAYLANEIARLA